MNAANPALLFGLLVLLAALPATPAAGDPADFGNSVVLVRVTSQARSAAQPWVATGVENSSGSGVMIEPGLILTNAHVVENATFVQVELLHVDDPVEARIEALNHQVDLALLRVEMPEGFTLSAPRIGDLPRMRDRVVIGGYPIGGSEISYTAGVVSRIDVDFYSQSGIKNLMVQTDAAINPGNSGGPVFLAENGALVGVATQYNAEGESLGYLIPVPVIRQFLADLKDDGVIQGIPNLGIHFQTLENPSLRAHLKMGKASGIRVTAVARGGTADGHLRVGDVLVAIDGLKVLNRGEVRLPHGGKIDHVAHVATRNVGDTVELSLLRDGEALKLSLPLKPYVYSVIPPGPPTGGGDAYVTYAGLVFVEVDANYLTRFDKDEPGVYRYFFDRPTGADGFERLVVISAVNAGGVNQGYEECLDIPVVEINGRPIGRLSDVKPALALPAEEDVIRLHDGSLVVLSRARVAAEAEELRRKYGIPGDGE